MNQTLRQLFLIISLFELSSSLTAQDPWIDAGPADTVTCPPECIDLTAIFEGGGGNTSDYTVSTIPFAPDPYTGTPLFLSDDEVSGILPIGFNFCFYGNTYSEFYISSNGWIGFSGGPAIYTSSAIPSVSPDVPKNCIMGPWYDIDPGDGGNVLYQVLGVAPSRRLVVSYQNVPHFFCGTDIETYQIILYETTNNIENHIASKNACLDWDDGQAVQGLHNIDGTAAVPSPGRNNTVWTAVNDAIRYTPIGDPDIEWYEGADLIGTGAAITLCPDVPTNYTVKLVSCGVEIATDEIFVDINCCEPPTIVPVHISCFGECDGQATATAVGLAPFDYLWDAAAGSQTTATATGLCAGTYTVTTTDSDGCVQTATVTITEPAELEATIELTNVTCEGASDGLIEITTTGGTAPITFNIGAGPVASGTFASLSEGSYTIVIEDDNGCSITLNPTITASPLPMVNFVADITAGCEPLTVIFDNLSDVGASNLWNFGDGSTSTAAGPVTHTYLNDGIYDVTLTVTNVGGCFTTLVRNDYINVYKVPDASFIFSPNQPTTIATEVSFTNYSIDADSWFWIFDNLGTSPDENPDFIFPEVAATYEITLIAITDNGCRDTLTKLIQVFQDQLMYIPNVFTPDGDSFNELFRPYFTGIDPFDFHMTIYNRWGEIMFESYDATGGWNGSFGGQIVPDGIYIWHIVTSALDSDKKLEFHGHVNLLR
jgi:gliding motility-associated-like protein